METHMHQKPSLNDFILRCFAVTITVYALICQDGRILAQQPDAPVFFDEFQGRWISGGSIEGRVLDQDNTGIADVCVTAFFTPCQGLKQQSVVTESNGSFKLTGLPPHTYYIHADASCQSAQNLMNLWWNGSLGTSDCKKAASISIQDSECKPNINFKLMPGRIIKGQVVDQSGEPVVDACVAATDYCAKHWHSGINTNSKGLFSLMGLEPDIYFLHIDPGCSANKRIDQEHWWAGGKLVSTDCQKAISIPGNMTSFVSDISFQISLKPELHGHIYTSKNKPVKNVCVHIRRYCEKEWFGTAISDVNGFFSFSQLPDETFYLETSVSCQIPQQFIDLWWNQSGGDPSCQKAEPIKNKAPENTFDFTLTKGNMVKGKIFRQNQSPVPGICVIASSQCKETFYKQTMTNDKGEYFLVLPDGRYYLYTDTACDSKTNLVDQWWNGRSGSLNCLNAREIHLNNHQIKHNIDFLLQTGGILKGSIVTNEKKPLPKACIGITQNCDQPVVTMQQADANGHFEMKLLPGAYYVQTDYLCKLKPTWKNRKHTDSKLVDNVFMDQWWKKSQTVSDCSEAEPVLIQAGKQSKPLHFVLSPGGIVSGHVMSVEGKPLHTIDIGIYDQSGKSLVQSTISTINGKFRAMLPSGSYYIRAMPSKSRTYNYYINEWWNGISGSIHIEGAKPLIVKNNVAQKNILFKLKKGGAVTGMVFSPGQHPIENIRVIASTPQKDVQWSYSTTNIHGQYVISGIPKGIQTIYVDSHHASPHYLYHWSYGSVTEHSVTIEPGTIQHIDPFILPKGGAISGCILTQTGEPIPEICVVAVQHCGNVYCGQAKTNQSGEYVIKGLPEGDYYVQTNTSCKDLPGDFVDMFWTQTKGIPVCKKANTIHVQKKQTTSQINFSLSKDIAFVGNVSTVSGDPIENVCIIVSNQCGTEWVGESLSDDKGNFIITGIPPGSWFLHTEVSCYQDQNYIDQWWHSVESTPDCNAAEPVELVHSNMKIPIQFSLPEQDSKVFVSESHESLPDGRYEETIEKGKVIINIKDDLLDVIVESVPLENVLQIISKYTGIKVLLYGTLKDKIFFDKRQAKLDDILLDLINGKAGHIFIYFPDRLMTSYIFSKDGQLKPKSLASNTSYQQAFQLNLNKPLSIMKADEIEDILRAPDRVEEKIHTLGSLIGYFDSQNALDLLTIALNDADEEVRMMAISVMNDLKENHLAVDDLTQALDRDLSPAVRALAAEALGEIGDKRAVRHLMDAMNDRDAGVRDTVSRAIKSIQGQ